MGRRYMFRHAEAPLRPIQTGCFPLVITLRTPRFHHSRSTPNPRQDNHSIHSIQFNMADVVTVTSNALAIAEIRSGILSPLSSECKAVSCASKDFYLSCVDDPSLTLNDFPLTDIEISRHCLPEGAEWPQIRDAIRAVSRFARHGQGRTHHFCPKLKPND